MPFHFTGCAPFIDRAADTLALTDAKLRARARTQEAVKRVQSALGQAAGAKPEQQAAIIAEAENWRAIAAVVLKGIEVAIAETKRGLGLDEVAIEASQADPDQSAPSFPSNRTPRRGR